MITLANKWVEFNDVWFLVGVDEGEFKYKLNDKIRIVDLKSPKFSLSSIKIIRQLWKIKPHYVISTLIYCNLITTLACLISLINTKIILREATTPTYDLRSKPKLLKYLVGFFYKRAHLIIAGSEGVKHDLVFNFGIIDKMVRVIDNPILSPDLRQKSLKQLDHPFFSNKQEPVILTVGKVTEAKDYLTLLRAFNIVLSKVSCKLIIIGNKFENSIEFKKLDHFIETNNLNNKVDFIGFHNNPFNYMKNADVFVLSSIFEGSPGVLIQALHINGNVVSTDCKSGPNEILEGGKYGRLVPVGDYKSMANAVIESIKHPYKFNNAPTLNKFELEKSCDNYFKAINSLN